MFRVALPDSKIASSVRRGSKLTLIAFVAAIALLAPRASSAPVSEVGTTVVTVKKVTGFLGQQSRPLEVGARVHLDEVLETGADSRAELQLDDKTKLALGANGRIRLDDYAAAQSGSGTGTRVVLNALKGALRFVTGSRDSKAYRIQTPSATIGVLGTVLDLYVHETDGTLIIVHEGAIEICARASPASLSRICRTFDLKDHIILACRNGYVSLPVKWAAQLLPGVEITTAFPFLQNPPQIDPVTRASYPQVTDETAAALQAIADARRRCGLPR